MDDVARPFLIWSQTGSIFKWISREHQVSVPIRTVHRKYFTRLVSLDQPLQDNSGRLSLMYPLRVIPTIRCYQGLSFWSLFLVFRTKDASVKLSSLWSLLFWCWKQQIPLFGNQNGRWSLMEEQLLEWLAKSYLFPYNLIIYFLIRSDPFAVIKSCGYKSLD